MNWRTYWGMLTIWGMEMQWSFRNLSSLLLQNGDLLGQAHVRIFKKLMNVWNDIFRGIYDSLPLDSATYNIISYSQLSCYQVNIEQSWANLWSPPFKWLQDCYMKTRGSLSFTTKHVIIRYFMMLELSKLSREKDGKTMSFFQITIEHTIRLISAICDENKFTYFFRYME